MKGKLKNCLKPFLPFDLTYTALNQSLQISILALHPTYYSLAFFLIFFFLSLNFDTCPQSWGLEEMHVVR